MGDLDLDQIADTGLGRIDKDRMQIVGFADKLPGLAARLFEQHAQPTPDHRVLGRLLLAAQQGLQFLQAGIGHLAGDLFPSRRRRARARRILEAERGAIADILDQLQRIGMILIGLAAPPEVTLISGRAARIRSIRRRYSAAVCLRFIAFSTLSEPDWTGRCR